MKNEHRLLFLAILLAAATWTMCAAVDSFAFSRGTFLKTFLLDVSGHDVAIRAVAMVGLVGFGVAAWIITARSSPAMKKAGRGWS